MTTSPTDNPFVIIGGDAAGLSAASKLKREDPDRRAVVFEKGQWVSYAHCGMPYYVKGAVDRLTDLLSLTPEEIAERGIDLRRGHEVVDIDTEASVVAVDGPSGRFEQPYGDLLIATGARAITAPFDGIALDGVFTLHDMDHAAALRAYLSPATAVDSEAIGNEYVDEALVRRYAAMEPPETAVIVGGGYVGVEMAEALRAHELEVHLFQRPEQILPPFGEAVGARIEAHLADHGVIVHTGTEVDDIGGPDAVTGVTAGDGRSVSTELVVVGVGIRPNTDFVDGAGIELGDSNAIAVDAYGRTSRQGVFAAGDCAEMRHTVTGEPTWVPLGLTANRAGRAIGQTVAGDPTPIGDIAGTAVVKAFDLGAGRTGVLDRDTATAAGFDPVAETVTAPSRSGYYPGAADTTVTMVADRDTGRLLGASTVGTDRAAIRIDPVATALQAGLTVAEFERLDLAYAPPFSPVWDPLLVAAKVLNGRLSAG